MAFWDFIKQLSLNDEEEKKRRQQGGFLNSVVGFADDRLDNAGDLGKKYIEAQKKGVGFAAGLGREMIVKPAVSVIASAEEKQQDDLKQNQLALIQKLKDIKPSEREDYIKNHPVLQNRLKDGKLEFKETTDPFLFGNIFRDKKTMAEVDIKDNSALERLTAQINEKDAANDKGRQSTNIVDRQIFGNEPIQAYQNREKGLEEAGWSKPMAIAGTGANIALDVPGVGTAGKVVKTLGKEGIEQLAKTGTREGVEQILKGKVGKEVLSKISQLIADSSDPKLIKQVLEQTDSSILKRVRSGKTAGEIADDVVSKARPATHGSEDLVKEFVDAANPESFTPKPSQTFNKVDGMSKEEEDLLGSLYSTSEIDAMGNKKKIVSKANEQAFDKNAPLTIFKETYKRSTGQDLPSDFDPKAIMQLSNGNDAAAKLQLEPVTKALSNTKSLDDVRLLGMARHIVTRRDTLPAATVAKAEAVLNNMQSRLGADFAKVDEAVGTVVKFNQDQLQRLVDAEIISPESFEYLKEANPNYFSNMGLVDHILNDAAASRAFGASGSHNRSRENIIKAVRGFEDESRAEFRDPIENIARTAAAVQKAVKDRELFNAIGEFEKIDPKLAFKQRVSEDVLKRMGLSLENQELRPVRDKLDRMMRTREMWVKKLQTESNNLEKKAYQTSLKEGGQTMPKFTPEGLGGKVPTAQATGKDMTKTALQTPAEKQMAEAIDSMGPGSPPPKLGPKDTQAFLRNLVEGPPAKIERLRKQINTRDVNAHKLLDEIEAMRAEYDDTVQRIVSNSEEAKQLMDKELPKGMKAITSMKNGIQERIAVPEEIHAIYAGLNKAQQDVVNGVSKRMLQFTKEMLTTYNPAFALVTNPIRDIAQSAFISKEVPLKDYLLVAPYAKRWAESFWGVLRQDEAFRAINAAGGGNSGQFVDDLDPEKYAKQVAARANGAKVLGINSGVVVKNPKDFLKLMAKVSVSPVIGAGKLIKKTGTVVEATTRGVEARAVIKRGGSLKEAALGNRTVSTDFLEGGKSAQVVNNFLPFFNARLQGTRNVVKAIKENPKRASVLITAGIGVPTVTAYAWNHTQYKDEYEQVGQDVKDNNFVIFFGKGTNKKGQPNEFITIPKNDIQKFFSNPIENAMRALANDDPESFDVIATKMLGGTLPIDTVKDGKFNASRTMGSLLAPIPKAGVQYVTNKNLYSDSQLVPDNLKGLPAEEQVRETTSPVDQFIAKALPGQQSPIKINAARTAITGNTVRNPVDSLASPLTASANAPTSEFYNILNKTSQKHDSASNKINEALKVGDYTEARKIANEYNEYLKTSFKPWAKKFSDKQTPELVDLYNKQKINLSKKSIQQRRANIQKKAALEKSQK